MLIWLEVGLCLIFAVAIGTGGFKLLMFLAFSPLLTLGFSKYSPKERVSLCLPALSAVIHCYYTGTLVV